MKSYKITPDDDYSKSCVCESPLIIMALANRFIAGAKRVVIEEIQIANDHSPDTVGIDIYEKL